MLDYASLAAVALVVREGSFERAARVLHVTPSAVSQRVRQIEERIGAVLIVRAQPCTATATGRLLCRHVEQVGMLEHELGRSLPRLAEARHGRPTLRIAVNSDSLATWFVDAMKRFQESDQALLDVVLDDEGHTLEWLRSGEVLAAVTAASKPVQGCDIVPLGRLRYAAVASPAYVARHFPRGVDAASLALAPSIHFDHKDRLQARWIRAVARRAVDVPVHWLPSIHAFVDASLAGVGWCVNSLPMIAPQLRAGTLVELVPGRRLAVPLYWQHTRSQIPLLGRLAHAVTAAARAALSAPML